MKISQEQIERATILAPRGPLIGAEADQLGRRVTMVLEDRVGPIVLDVSNVPLVDSRGLEVIVEATERLIRGGEVLKLCGANGTLKEVFELTEVAPLFEQFDDVDAAVGSL